MVKFLKKITFKEFYKINEEVAKTSPMRTHYNSPNFFEKWFWTQKKAVIKSWLKTIKINNIIDLGCGDGGLIETVDENVLYTGIDISPTQVLYTRQYILNIGRKNSLIYNGDILDLDFRDDQFDAALVCDVLEHVIDPEKLLSEVKRLVKKDGFIIFSIPNEFLLQLARAMLLRFPLRSPDHLTAIFPGDIIGPFPKVIRSAHIPISFSYDLSLINIYLVKNDK